MDIYRREQLSYVPSCLNGSYKTTIVGTVAGRTYYVLIWVLLERNLLQIYEGSALRNKYNL